MTELHTQINNPTFKITIVILMVLSGSLNIIAFKFQNTQYVYEGAFYKIFFHPFIQTAVMFFGQFLALIIYEYKKNRDPQGHKQKKIEAQLQGKQVQIDLKLLAIPAILDLLSSTLQFTALNFIPGSVYQMMRGGTIVTTFIFSIIFLKQKMRMKMIVGSCLALAGITLVGISNIIFSGQSSSSSSIGLQIIGYILLMTSLVFNGFLFVFEQRLFQKYHLDPLQAVGMEGLYGLCIYFFIIPVISSIPCRFGVNTCTFDQYSMPFVENYKAYFREAAQSNILFFFCILGIATTAAYNIFGVSVTKYINALARSIADVTRTLLIWAVGILITVSLGHTYPNYRWQIVNIWAIFVELIGFCILVLGNLIYNDVIQVCGNNKLLIDSNKETQLIQLKQIYK